MKSASLEQFLEKLPADENIKNLYRRRGRLLGWLAMCTVTLAIMATLMASTIINVAIPDIMNTFNIGQDKAQWLATAFFASCTVTMLLTSWFVQARGYRATMIIAISVFTAGAFLGGISPNPDILTIARILQGAATGVVTPMGASLVFLLFPPGRQGLVMGVTAIGVVLAPALGPPIGGVLIDNFSWRYTYFMAIPFSLLVIPMAMLFLPQREPEEPTPRLDWQGLALVSLAIFSLLIGLNNGQQQGWGSSSVVFWLVTALLATAAFLYWETHTKNPLLDLRVFGFYRFTMVAILSFIFGAGLFGSIYLFPLFVQIGQGLSATASGFMMLPAALVMGALFPVSGWLSDRMDQRLLMGIGFMILAWSCWLMAGGDALTPAWTLAWWLIISRIGIGLMATTINLSAMQGLAPQYIHQGAGAINFIRQLGSAFGINLTSIALSHRVNFHHDTLVTARHPDQSIYQQAYIYAFQDSFLMLAAVFAATILPLAMLRQRHMKTLH